MKLFAKNKKKGKDSIIRKIEQALSILVDKYNFEIIEEIPKQRRIVIFRNDFVQIEIAAEESYFHCEIRKLIKGVPAIYCDKNNSIGFEDIAILESNHNYNHLDYFAGGSRMVKVLEKTKDLLMRNPEIISTDKWIDYNQLNQLKEDHFTKTFGKKRNPDQKPFIDLVDSKMKELLVSIDFEKKLDSRNIAPYDPRAIVGQLEYQKGKKTVKLSQIDWRDYYFIWKIEVNGVNIMEVDLKEIKDHNKAIEMIENKLKEEIGSS